MGAVRTKVVGHIRHRRLQAFVIVIVFLLASGAATIALDTLVEAQAPYDHAFAAANGAHLTIEFDATASPAQLAATTHAAPVTESAGPWPVGQAGFLLNPGDAGKGGPPLFEPGAVSGRDRPDTAVDRIAVAAGRWWSAPAEIVLTRSRATQYGISVGATIQLQQLPAPLSKGGGPKPQVPAPGGSETPTGASLLTRTFTVVGIASSISTPDVYGWLSPSDVAWLSAGTPPLQEMLYRVSSAATDADLAAATTAITTTLPASETRGVTTYLTAKSDVDRTASIFVPILLAFSAFALLAAAFVIVNVVSGIVLSSYRDIGLMKAIGYTPRQVVAILVAEILVPATAGATLGVAAGTVASQPIIAQTSRAFGLPTAFDLSVPVVAGVLIAVTLSAIVAAVGPAVAAGRLSTVDALARGAMPSRLGQPGRLQRSIWAWPVRPSIRLGIGAGLANRLRATMTVGALVVGVAALVFAVGLELSLQRVAADLIRDRPSPVRVDLIDPQYPPENVTAAIAAQPGTGRYVAIASRDISVARAGTIPFIAYRGDASWLGYALIEGRWFSGPSEAVAPTNFLTVTGLHVGDSFTVSLAGRSRSLTLVGEIFDQAPESRDDLVLRGSWDDLIALDPGVTPDRWEVQPASGVETSTYRSALGDATDRAVSIEIVADSSTNEGFLLFEGVIGSLGAVLVAISLGGVFNTVLLDTRGRTRQTAVLKAIGMAPAQVVQSVLASIVPLGVIAGSIGVPLGLVMQRTVLSLMGQAATKTDIPAQAVDVFPPVVLVALAAGGVAIGVLGAWLPARRAAVSRIAPVLQAE